jgi:hypothetical protein
MIRDAIFALLILAPISASAGGFVSGNYLLEQCTKPAGEAFCAGYVSAIADAMDRGDGLSGARACFRQGVTVQQIKDAVVQYLRAHIADRDYIADGLVAFALRKTFPCP